MTTNQFIAAYITIAAITTIIFLVLYYRKIKGDQYFEEQFLLSIEGGAIPKLSGQKFNLRMGIELIGGILVAILWPLGLIFIAAFFIMEMFSYLSIKFAAAKMMFAIMINSDEFDVVERDALVNYERDRKSHAYINREPLDYFMRNVELCWRIYDAGGIHKYFDSSQKSDQEPTEDICVNIREPEAELDEWGFYKSSDFEKCLERLDKSMRESLLIAIKDISVSPIEKRAEIQIPLKGNLSDFWRYCFGEYSIIYKHNSSKHRIDFIYVGKKIG